jgi:hypothetical protein
MNIKAVDKDNLPEGEVLAFGQGEFLVGYLEPYITDVSCESEGVFLEHIESYIDLKDLKAEFIALGESK